MPVNMVENFGLLWSNTWPLLLGGEKRYDGDVGDKIPDFLLPQPRCFEEKVSMIWQRIELQLRLSRLS